MLPASLLNSLQKEQDSQTSRLRSVPSEDRRDRSAPSANISALNQAVTVNEDEIRKTFFHSGADSWYQEIADLTFTSTFCTLTPKEAKVIVNHWQTQEYSIRSSGQPDPVLLKETIGQLHHLVQRLDHAVKLETAKSAVSKAFVKLSTRSPKDSRKVLAQAAQAYHKKISKMETEPDSNTKWKILSEEVANASAIKDGMTALEFLLDSFRVYEDLKFALDGEEGVGWNVSLVARAWDPRVGLQTEFRGICWNGRLTCLCQYFHPLYFPELVDQKADIQRDILECFGRKEVQAAVSNLGGCCIIDFARVDPGEVVIIELNPFDGLALGSFPGSTGLFLWEDPKDHKIMTGGAPFEFRIREAPMEEHKLKVDFHKGWRDIVYGTKAVI